MPSGKLNIRRALAECEKRGWKCDKAECYNFAAKRSSDLFGVFDIVGIDPRERRIIGIQTTSFSQVPARRHKIMASKLASVWLQAGGKIVIWGFRKRGKGVLRRIELREEWISEQAIRKARDK